MNIATDILTTRRYNRVETHDAAGNEVNLIWDGSFTFDFTEFADYQDHEFYALHDRLVRVARQMGGGRSVLWDRGERTGTRLAVWDNGDTLRVGFTPVEGDVEVRVHNDYCVLLAGGNKTVMGW